MASRTVIINGDRRWRFRALVWSQALDLFPQQSGVEFLDCAPDDQMHVDHRVLLGSFPEDVSADSFALQDELREHILTLVQDREHRLAIAVVLGREDLKSLAAMHKQRRAAAMTGPARSAVDALRAAMHLVVNQTETANELSPAVTRLWISLVVRDGGAAREDAGIAHDAMSALDSDRCKVANVFFLSNGRDLDTAMGAPERHFAKLRLLADLLHSADGASTLRRRRRDGDGTPPVLWLTVEPHDLERPAMSAELRRALVQESERLLGDGVAQTDPDVLEDFQVFRQGLNGVIPELAGDSYTRATAASALETDVDRHQVSARAKEDREAARQDARDIAEVLADLRPRRRRLRRRGTDGQRAMWKRLAAEYEGAFGSTAAVYDGVIRERIAQVLEEGRRKAVERSALLRDVRIPTGTAGTEAVDALADTLALHQTRTVREIEESQDSRIRFAGMIAQEKGFREQAFALLDRAEAQMLRWGSMRVFAAFLFFLLPVAVNAASRWRHLPSSMGWGKLIGPLGFFAVGLVVLALLAAAFLWTVLARQRRKVLADVHKRLELNYDWLKQQYAALLSVAYNRKRMIAIRQTLQAIRPQMSADVVTAVREVTERMRRGDDVPGRRTAPGIGLTRDAVDGFKARRNWQERFSGFLTNAANAAPVEVKTSFREWEIRLRTTSVLEPVRLILREPGDVR